MVIWPEHLSPPGVAHSGWLGAVLSAAARTLAFTAGELVSTVESKSNCLHPVRFGRQAPGQD